MKNVKQYYIYSNPISFVIQIPDFLKKSGILFFHKSKGALAESTAPDKLATQQWNRSVDNFQLN